MNTVAKVVYSPKTTKSTIVEKLNIPGRLPENSRC